MVKDKAFNDGNFLRLHPPQQQPETFGSGNLGDVLGKVTRSFGVWERGEAFADR